MIAFKPLKLAFWLAVGGISFGMALNAGWLIFLGVMSPIAVLGGFLLYQLLQA